MEDKETQTDLTLFDFSNPFVLFINSLDGKEYEVNQLVANFNQFVGDNLSVASFSHMRIVRESFSKRTIRVDGKKTTFYKKNI